MLDINLIRENPERVRQSLRDRQMDASVVDGLLEMNEQRRALSSCLRFSKPSATPPLKRSPK